MYPTTLSNPVARSTPAPAPMSPDCLQAVIVQTVSTLQDIEAKLEQILQKIQPTENKGYQAVVPHGVNIARNATSRIIDLCIVLDNLI